MSRMEPDIRTAINEAGGATHVARKLGIPVATVQTWKRTNKLPLWRMGEYRRIVEAKL